MRRLFALAIAFAVAIAPTVPAHAVELPPAAAEVLSPAELVARQTRYDGEVVRVAGEAIGEALRAGDGEVWVNVLGDGLLLGTVVDQASASAIRTYGDYGHKGDEVVVTGEFHISCTVHSGETDIHVTGLEIVRRGRVVSHSLPWTRLVAGLGAVALAGMLGVLYRRREHQVPGGH